MAEPTGTCTWHVYQLRSDTELLYVGYTRWLKARLASHRREKPWWPEVTDIRFEEFTAEEDARLREKELWSGLRPKYNKNSPFVTAEDAREQERQRERKPEPGGRARDRTPRRRLYDRLRDQSPERRNRDRNRKNKASYNECLGLPRNRKGTPQTGPGLF